MRSKWDCEGLHRNPLTGDTQLEIEGKGGYQEDMNELTWTATKAMCER